MNDKTDEELIKDFQNGNINSYNHLVFRYKDRLFNYIYQFVHDIDLAEDLLSVQKKIGYLSEQSPLYPEMTIQEYLH